MVGRGEFMDVHEGWVRGKTVSESQAAELRQNSPFNGLLGQAIWEELVAEIKEDARAASS